MAQIIPINGNDPGLNFDGVGTISAGGESRLFQDYAPAQRAEILDFMFCNPRTVPQTSRCTNGRFGAAPNDFKVEMGGEGNSSVGAEPSFLRSQAEFDAIVAQGATAATCHLPTSDLTSATDLAYWGRGQQWRLMREAKLRNPNLKFHALPWSAPGYLNNQVFSGAQTHQYYLWFARCAMLNGTKLSSMGLQNESTYDIDWVIGLRNTLSLDADLDINLIEVVAADGGWEPVTTDMLNNSLFRDAVNVVGQHYENYSTPESTQSLITTYGKRLYGAELGPLNYNATDWAGALEMAEQFVRYYVQGKVTAVWQVAALNSYYQPLDFGGWPAGNPGNGMIDTFTPWNNGYRIKDGVWAMAHVGQFAGPGWRAIDSASCLFGNGSCATSYIAPDPTGVEGSFVTYRQLAPGTAWTMVAETRTATANRTLDLCPTGGLATPTSLRVRTSSSSASLFVASTISRNTTYCGGGAYGYRITINPGKIYTFTTLTTGGKGTSTPPTPSASTLPYYDDFENRATGGAYNVGETPQYLSDLKGSFEIAQPIPTESMVIRMVSERPPIEWPAVPEPTHPRTVIGHRGRATDPVALQRSWCNYSAIVGVKINGNQYGGATGWAGLLSRAVAGDWLGREKGYELRLYNNNSYELIIPTDPSPTVLSGSVPTSSGWQMLELRVDGTRVVASITAVDTGQVTTRAYTDSVERPCGLAGLESGWNPADFDAFLVDVYNWDFSTTGELQGWNTPNDLTTTVSGGQLNLNITGVNSDPYIHSPANLDLPGSTYKVVNTTITNNTGAAQTGQIYFVTAADPNWDEAKSKTFTIPTGTNTLNVDMSTVAGWTDETVTQLRFDPEQTGQSGQTFNVDEIRVNQS